MERNTAIGPPRCSSTWELDLRVNATWYTCVRAFFKFPFYNATNNNQQCRHWTSLLLDLLWKHPQRLLSATGLDIYHLYLLPFYKAVLWASTNLHALSWHTTPLPINLPVLKRLV